MRDGDSCPGVGEPQAAQREARVQLVRWGPRALGGLRGGHGILELAVAADRADHLRQHLEAEAQRRDDVLQLPDHQHRRRHRADGHVAVGGVAGDHRQHDAGGDQVEEAAAGGGEVLVDVGTHVRSAPRRARGAELRGDHTSRPQHPELRGRVGLDGEADEVLGEAAGLGTFVLGPAVPRHQPAAEQEAGQRRREEPEQPGVGTDRHDQGHHRHHQVADGVDHAVVGAAERALPLADDLGLVTERRRLQLVERRHRRHQLGDAAVELVPDGLVEAQPGLDPDGGEHRHDAERDRREHRPRDQRRLGPGGDAGDHQPEGEGKQVAEDRADDLEERDQRRTAVQPERRRERQPQVAEHRHDAAPPASAKRSAWRANIRAYPLPAATSSSWVPSSTRRPPSRTTIRSA